MGPGGIATIIAASSLAVIAVAISYTVIRASRLIDEITTTISLVNKSFIKSLASPKDNVGIVDKPKSLLKSGFDSATNFLGL